MPEQIAKGLAAMSDRSTLTWPHSHRHPVRRAPEQMGAGKGRQAGHFCSGLSLRLAAAAAAHGNVHMVYSGIVRATDENLRRVWRDKRDESGASIRMRRGGRVIG